MWSLMSFRYRIIQDTSDRFETKLGITVGFVRAMDWSISISTPQSPFFSLSRKDLLSLNYRSDVSTGGLDSGRPF